MADGMMTTIQLNKETRERLSAFKDYSRESYDEVVRKLMKIAELSAKEGNLNKKIIKEVEGAREELRAGKGISTNELLKRLALR
jgi:hypothetical protein